MKFTRGSIVVLLVVSGLSSVVVAEQPSSLKTVNSNKHPFLNGVELSVAGGVNWLHSKDTHLVISSFETDNNQVHNVANHGGWKVGLGYRPFEQQLNGRPFLDSLLFEMNLYYSSSALKGVVWQYQLPELENYRFLAPVSNTRLMFDFKPTLFTWHTVSPYAIVGVGSSWNKASYSENVIAVDVDRTSALLLGHHTTTHVAGDFGAGIRIQLSEKLSVLTEYIYTLLGHATPANDPANQVNLMSPPTFSLQNQCVLFGINLIL